MAANDEDKHLLKDLTAPQARELNMGYTVPAVQVNEFKLKPALINIVSQN
jgi:hypothetical protein